jgi:hypothetical protein
MKSNFDIYSCRHRPDWLFNCRSQVEPFIQHEVGQFIGPCVTRPPRLATLAPAMQWKRETTARAHGCRSRPYLSIYSPGKVPAKPYT